MSAATSKYQKRVDKLDDLQKDIGEIVETLVCYSSEPTIFDVESVELHFFERLISNLSSKLFSVLSGPRPVPMPNLTVSSVNGQPVLSTQPASTEASDETSQAVPGGEFFENTVGKAICGIIAAIILFISLFALVGYSTPLLNQAGMVQYQTMPDGSYAALTEHVSYLPLSWCILLIAFGVCIGILPFLLPFVLQHLTKKPEEALPPPQKVGKWFSDQLADILHEHMGCFQDSQVLTPTKKSLPELAPLSHDSLYSQKAQNLLFFPGFVVEKTNCIQAVSNAYIEHERNVLYKHMDNVSAPAGGMQR